MLGLLLEWNVWSLTRTISSKKMSLMETSAKSVITTTSYNRRIALRSEESPCHTIPVGNWSQKAFAIPTPRTQHDRRHDKNAFVPIDHGLSPPPYPTIHDITSENTSKMHILTTLHLISILCFANKPTSILAGSKFEIITVIYLIYVKQPKVTIFHSSPLPQRTTKTKLCSSDQSRGSIPKRLLVDHILEDHYCVLLGTTILLQSTAKSG